MIVEFVGCPGVGKSSVCRLIMQNNESAGYSVRNIHRSEMREGPFARKRASLMAQLSPGNRRLRAALERYMKDIPDQASRVWAKDLLIAANRLKQKDILALDYAFFEEGPAQYVTSIAHLSPFSDAVLPVIDAMNQTIYAHEIIGFYVKADLSAVAERIKKRNKKTDRFIFDDAEEMLAKLSVKARNIEYLTERLNYKALYCIENKEFERAVEQVQSILERERKR